MILHNVRQLHSSINTSLISYITQVIYQIIKIQAKTINVVMINFTLVDLVGKSLFFLAANYYLTNYKYSNLVTFICVDYNVD